MNMLIYEIKTDQIVQMVQKVQNVQICNQDVTIKMNNENDSKMNE